MKKLSLCLILSLFLITLGSAYTPHSQNTSINWIEEVANATSCQITSIQYPDNSISFINDAFEKNGQSFNYTINEGNFTQLGVTCARILCQNPLAFPTDAEGSKCWEITPSGRNDNLGFYIIIIGLVYGISLIGFFGKNEVITLLGSLSMFWIGIYIINNGLVIYQDFLTNGIAYVSIGLGAYLSFVAAYSLYQDL